MNINDKLEECIVNNAGLFHIFKNNGSLESMIIFLAEQIKIKDGVIIKNMALIPKKVKISENKYMIYRCPEELIPITDYGKLI